MATGGSVTLRPLTRGPGTLTVERRPQGRDQGGLHGTAEFPAQHGRGAEVEVSRAARDQNVPPRGAHLQVVHEATEQVRGFPGVHDRVASAPGVNNVEEVGAWDA